MILFLALHSPVEQITACSFLWHKTKPKCLKNHSLGIVVISLRPSLKFLFSVYQANLEREKFLAKSHLRDFNYRLDEITVGSTIT